MPATPRFQLTDDPRLRQERHKLAKLETQLGVSEAARLGLVVERNRLEEERREATVEQHLGNNEGGFRPDGVIRLRAIDAELASLDVAIAALREAITRQGEIAGKVRVEATAAQRGEALKRAKVLVAENFDLLTEFLRRQNELIELYKGPLKQTRGFPNVSLPILVTNFSAWSRVALDFIAPRISSRSKTA